ncbi:hypothetical protein P7C70_g5126, partial [Phenoliferia sp. Uapishka_3]
MIFAFIASANLVTIRQAAEHLIGQIELDALQPDAISVRRDCITSLYQEARIATNALNSLHQQSWIRTTDALNLRNPATSSYYRRSSDGTVPAIEAAQKALEVVLAEHEALIDAINASRTAIRPVSATEHIYATAVLLNQMSMLLTPLLCLKEDIKERVSDLASLYLSTEVKIFPFLLQISSDTFFSRNTPTKIDLKNLAPAFVQQTTLSAASTHFNVINWYFVLREPNKCAQQRCLGDSWMTRQEITNHLTSASDPTLRNYRLHLRSSLTICRRPNSPSAFPLRSLSLSLSPPQPTNPLPTRITTVMDVQLVRIMVSLHHELFSLLSNATITLATIRVRAHAVLLELPMDISSAHFVNSSYLALNRGMTWESDNNYITLENFYETYEHSLDFTLLLICFTNKSAPHYSCRLSLALLEAPTNPQPVAYSNIETQALGEQTGLPTPARLLNRGDDFADQLPGTRFSPLPNETFTPTFEPNLFYSNTFFPLTMAMAPPRDFATTINAYHQDAGRLTAMATVSMVTIRISMINIVVNLPSNGFLTQVIDFLDTHMGVIATNAQDHTEETVQAMDTLALRTDELIRTTSNQTTPPKRQLLYELEILSLARMAYQSALDDAVGGHRQIHRITRQMDRLYQNQQQRTIALPFRTRLHDLLPSIVRIRNMVHDQLVIIDGTIEFVKDQFNAIPSDH